jgi:chaperonin GroES
MAKDKKNIIPLGDRVLIQTKDKEEKTHAGIIIPDTVDKERPEMGEVIAVGEGKTGDKGEVIPMKVKVGDTVLFTKYGPDEVTIDNDDYLIVSEGSILAVLK